MSRGILVVGPHRSGTSAVAGVLECLGVDMGKPSKGWPTYPSNPNGQFEDPKVVRLLDDIVGNWRFPATHAFPSVAVDALVDYLNERHQTVPLWGIKDPRLCFVTQVLTDRKVDCRFLFVTRNIESAARSIVAREPYLPDQVGLFLATQYFLALAAGVGAARDKVPALSIAYENLVADPHREVLAIVGFLATGYQAPTPEQVDAAIDFIDPNLNHHKGPL